MTPQKLTLLAKDLQNYINSHKLEDTKLFTDMNEFAKYVEYGLEGLLGMTFEGELYSVLNYGQGYETTIYTDLEAICEKHNVFYEQGNAWNCSFYSI